MFWIFFGVKLKQNTYGTAVMNKTSYEFVLTWILYANQLMIFMKMFIYLCVIIDQLFSL